MIFETLTTAILYMYADNVLKLETDSLIYINTNSVNLGFQSLVIYNMDHFGEYERMFATITITTAGAKF